MLRRKVTEEKSASAGLVQLRLMFEPSTEAVKLDGAAVDAVSMLDVVCPAEDMLPAASMANRL